MEVQEVKQSVYADLFPAAPADQEGIKTAKFGASDTPVDMFPPTPDKLIIEPKPEASTEPVDPAVPKPDDSKDVDLFKDIQAPKVDKPEGAILDLTSYFEDRLNSGKFVSIVDDVDGKPKKFIPKTPEEFDEVIDIQVNYKLEEQKKTLDQNWYESKSPAWQAVAKYAELTDNPGELLPFLQGVRQIDSVKDLDPADPIQAEQIIRARLQQRGDTEDIIEEQIETLKTADKLSRTAQSYKPLILKQESEQLSRLVQEKEQEENEWKKVVMSVKENAIKAIESPIFGKQKMKADEKSAVFGLIGLPSPQTKGYPIYTEIDRLFEQGDFETLTKLALLIAKKDSFLGYVSAGGADKAAEGLQRKLRVATEQSAASGGGNEGSEARTVRRDAYSNPKFGRNG